ncbi:hypothetical protein KXZ74_26080, partial [Escherichia coli]|nr:hypothetical protein [Escherichia coli]
EAKISIRIVLQVMNTFCIFTSSKTTPATRGEVKNRSKNKYTYCIASNEYVLYIHLIQNNTGNAG